MIKNVSVITLGICLVAGVFGWFRGWETAFQYGGGIVIGSMTMLIFSIFTASHQWRRTEVYHLSAGTFSDSSETPSTPASGIEKFLHNFRIPIQLGLVGIIGIFLGTVIQAVF